MRNSPGSFLQSLKDHNERAQMRHLVPQIAAALDRVATVNLYTLWRINSLTIWFYILYTYQCRVSFLRYPIYCLVLQKLSQTVSSRRLHQSWVALSSQVNHNFDYCKIISVQRQINQYFRYEFQNCRKETTPWRGWISGFIFLFFIRSRQGVIGSSMLDVHLLSQLCMA